MKLLLIIIAPVLLTLIPAHSVSQVWQNQQGEKIALYINNSPVSETEFQLIKQKKRGDAVAYFSREFGPLPSSNFWQMCFDGTSPSYWIEQAITDELIDNHAQLTLLHRYGVTQTQLSYNDLKQKMLNENQKRSHAIANKQVVYGLANFNFEKYKSHFLSVGFNKVRTKIKQQSPLPDEQLQEIYQQRKDKDFLESMTFSIQAMKLSPKINLSHKPLLSQLKQELDTFTSETLHTKYNNHESIRYLEKHFTSESRKSDEFIWTFLLNQVKHQKQGDIFQSNDIDGNNYLIKLNKKSLPTAQPLERVKHIIENDYAQQIYQKALDAVIQETKVNYHPNHKKTANSNSCNVISKIKTPTK